MRHLDNRVNIFSSLCDNDILDVLLSPLLADASGRDWHAARDEHHAVSQ